MVRIVTLLHSLFASVLVPVAWSHRQAHPGQTTGLSAQKSVPRSASCWVLESWRNQPTSPDSAPPPWRLRALPGQLTFKRIKYSEWARTTRTVTRPVGQSPHVGSEGTSPCLNAFSKLCICCCLLVRSGYNYAGGQPEQEQKYAKERQTNPFRGS